MYQQSSQHHLSNKNPPRVHITYDVEKGQAIESKELPFVLGILSDLTHSKTPLQEKRFIDISAHNFDEVMSALSPHLSLKIKGHLYQLTFKKIEDFDPLNIVKQSPKLKEVYDTVEHLSDLVTKAENNEKLFYILQEIPKHLKTLKGGVTLNNIKKILETARSFHFYSKGNLYIK